MKPTHGLVPYTGIMPIEIFVDHTGPMTRTVTDNALLLEVIAGPDGYDPRQYAPRVQSYTDGLERGVQGRRIALVREGFGRPECEPAVDAKVRQGAELFKKLGATVDEVSIPMHLLGPAIWTPIGVEGITQTAQFIAVCSSAKPCDIGDTLLSVAAPSSRLQARRIYGGALIRPPTLQRRPVSG